MNERSASRSSSVQINTPKSSNGHIPGQSPSGFREVVGRRVPVQAGERYPNEPLPLKPQSNLAFIRVNGDVYVPAQYTGTIPEGKIIPHREQNGSQETDEPTTNQLMFGTNPKRQREITGSGIAGGPATYLSNLGIDLERLKTMSPDDLRDVGLPDGSIKHVMRVLNRDK